MSLFNKTWKFPEPAPAEFFTLNEEYSRPFNQLLWTRNFREKKKIDNFLNLDYEKHLHSPYLLRDIKKASTRILKAIKKDERILIYGDYDADGVCGATLLYQVLTKLGASNLKVYIPDRSKEGYGLNLKAIDGFIKTKTELIITIDCGSTNFEEVKYAEKNGMDVIITDHHQVLLDKKFSYALVNPHQKGDKYPFKQICGTAVVFKLSQVLILEYNKQNIKNAIPFNWTKWLLDLVAIATITDVMPLLDENRVFVKYGMIVLTKTKRKGLKALMRKAKMRFVYDIETKTTNLSSYSIGFILGPRLNAAGRMDHASLAFDLLNTEDSKEAERIASDLEIKNRERQNLVINILNEVETNLFENRGVIFVGREHWPIGVLGIVAGRLSDRHQKPAFVYQRKDNFLVGSVRSPEFFNIVDIMKGAGSLLEKFGGHKRAGGFTALLSNETKLEEIIVNYTDKLLKNTDNINCYIEIDAEIEFKNLTEEFYKEVLKLEPLGEGNSKPIFCLKHIYFSDIRMVGSNNQHFKCNIINDLSIGTKIKAIGFGVAQDTMHLQNGQQADILFNIDIDEWNGYRNLVLKLIDISVSSSWA